MPVEIKELVIRTNIAADNAASSDGATGTSQDKHEIVTECVEQVMRLLKQKAKR